MRSTSLSPRALSRRAALVFDLMPGERVHDVEIRDDGQTYVSMSEMWEGERIPFYYVPDMSDRPQALAYLMGDADRFDD